MKSVNSKTHCVTRIASTVLQSNSSMKGREAIPLYAGCTPASQTIVLPRYCSTQQERPTSCPAPNRVTLSVGASAILCGMSPAQRPGVRSFTGKERKEEREPPQYKQSRQVAYVISFSFLITSDNGILKTPKVQWTHGEETGSCQASRKKETKNAFKGENGRASSNARQPKSNPVQGAFTAAPATSDLLLEAPSIGQRQ